MSVEAAGDLRVYLAGPAGVSLVDPSGEAVDGVLTLPASEPAVVTLRAPEQVEGSMTGALVVATANEVVTAEVTLAAASPSGVQVLDPLVRPMSVPAWGRSTHRPVTVAVPEDAYLHSSPQCPEDGHDASVGYLSGPGARWASVCRRASELYVSGIDSAGSWTGTLDLAPGVEDEGLELTINARHEWFVPFIALVFGLLVAMLFPLNRAVLRPRLMQRAGHQRLREAVLAAQQRTQEAVRKAAAPDRMRGGIDLVVGVGEPLLFDRRLAEARVDFDGALDAKTREDHLPGGSGFEKLETLRNGIIDHFEVLAVAARDARSLVAELRDFGPPGDLDPAASGVLKGPLIRADHPISLGPDWQKAKEEADFRRASLSRFKGLWDRIQSLPPETRDSLAVRLIQAHPAHLDALETTLKDKEAELNARAVSQDLEPAPPPAAASPPDATPPVDAASSRRRSRPALLGSLLLVLLVVALVGITRPLGVDDPVVPLWAALDRLWAWFDMRVWTLALAAAAGLAVYAVYRLRGRMETWAIRHPAKAVRLFDRILGVVGGVVVVATGWAMLYLANETFGSASDYVGIITWGFGLGSGVQLARQLLPLPAQT